MGNRLLFKVNAITNGEDHCIGWLYEHWAADDAYELKIQYSKVLKKMKLVGASTPYEAVKALIATGKAFFGGEYAIQNKNSPNRWEGNSYSRSTIYLYNPKTQKNECKYDFPEGHPNSEIYDIVMQPNDDLLEQYPELRNDFVVETKVCPRVRTTAMTQLVPNTSPRFYVGTGDLYPSYIQDWCENVVEITFDTANPEPLTIGRSEGAIYRSDVVPAIRKNIKTVNNLLKSKRGKQVALTDDMIITLAALPYVEMFGAVGVSDQIRKAISEGESSVSLRVCDAKPSDARAQTTVDISLNGCCVKELEWDGEVEFFDNEESMDLFYEVNKRGDAVGEFCVG